MSLRFIFGASGAGKTEYLLQYFLKHAPENFRKNWFLIVPEQDTLAMQKKILAHPENKGHGILNIDVLSFDRLAYRVFEELRLQAMTIIDDTGKIMILRSVTEKIKAKLCLYQRELNKPGFLDSLKSQISEFYQYHITPEMLDLAAEHAEAQYTRSKLRDLALIYEHFQRYMEAHGYHTQEEVLDQLYAHLPESTLLQDAVVAFDGFTGFTPIQLRILEEILPVTSETLVSCEVSSDAQDSIYDVRGPEDLFYLSRQTVEKLTKMAETLKVPMEAAIDVNRYDARTGEERLAGAPLPRFVKAPALSTLEHFLYRFDTVKKKTAPDSSLTIWEAMDLRQEVEAMATCIEEAVRQEELRYQDIGIILTNPESYRDIVYKIFSEAQIPYFYDDPGSLLDSPYAELMRAALEAVDRNFTFDAVMRFLRALPMVSEEREQHIDALDNELRATGLRGASKYDTVWLEEDGSTGAREALRQELILPLLHLRSHTSERAATVAVRVEALENLMTEMHAAEAMEALVASLRAEGELNRAESLEESVTAIETVLTQLRTLLGETRMSRTEFRDVLDSGLRQASVRVIPATLDQVVIGDLTRSRFSNPRLFFVAGLTANEVPKAEADTKLLTDRDRQLFKELELELAPDRVENALVQRFYIYRALLNPSEHLVLSYALKGRDGKGCRPSGLIQEIRHMFTELPVEKLRFRAPRVYTLKEAERFVSSEFQDMEEYLSSLYTEETEETAESAEGGDAELERSHRRERKEKAQMDSFLRYLAILSRDPTQQDRAEQLLKASFTKYEESLLSKAVASELYGARILGSITRLENYSQCAYQHFLRYGLRLQERESFDLQMYDIGNLYHGALEQSFRKAKEEKRPLEKMEEAELRTLAAESVSETSASYNHGILMDTARNQYLVRKATDITSTTLWALAEQLRRGDFRVDGLEKSFDYLREDMRLTGRIDRVDIAEDEGHVYVKVIDYKSGKTSFDLTRIYDGMQLQLTTYLNVAMAEAAERYPDREIVPAAMFYYHIEDPVLDYDPARTASDTAHERLKKLMMDGLVNTELSVVQKLDHEIQQSSDILPVTIKAGVVDASKKNVASTKRFQDLRHFVDRKMQGFAREIRSGVIGVHPIRLSSDTTACSWCPYHSICGFDPRIEGYQYRSGTLLKPEDIWNEISPEEKSHGMDDGTETGH